MHTEDVFDSMVVFSKAQWLKSTTEEAEGEDDGGRLHCGGGGEGGTKEMSETKFAEFVCVEEGKVAPWPAVRKTPGYLVEPRGR